MKVDDDGNQYVSGKGKTRGEMTGGLTSGRNRQRPKKKKTLNSFDFTSDHTCSFRCTGKGRK